MAEQASTIPAWRVGGQIDEATANGIAELADIIVVATLVGFAGVNVVDPTNGAHVLRGPYTTVVGGLTGTATVAPAADGNTTLAGRLWWTEPLKATTAADPNDALQPSGLAWQISVTAITRRGISHTLATFLVSIDADRDYLADGETVLVPSGTGGAEQAAIGVIWLEEPPATVADNTFEARVLDVIDDNGITGTPELPVAGSTGQALVKASNTDFDVAWATIEAGGGNAVVVADVDPTKYALWSGTGTPTAAADSTADFQAAFDALPAQYSDHLGGITIKFPKGAYVLGGTVTIPNMQGQATFTIDMQDVTIYHRPAVATASMFRTGTPTSNTDAETINAWRNMWTWRGGYYRGNSDPASTGWELNAVSRMVMERVRVYFFGTGVHGRFALHYNLRDSMFQNNITYQVRIEAEDGCWTGRTPANSASNGTVIENVRFYGRSTELAQVRIAHSGHTVRDCTFEGAGPAGYNYEFQNNNTSVLTSKVENLWVENTPGIAHVKVDTPHQFDFDMQYSNTSAVVADIHECSLFRVRRMPWPAAPLYKVNSKSAIGANVVVVFDHSGRGGRTKPYDEALWVDRVFPLKVAAYGFAPDDSPVIYMTGSGGTSNTRGQVWEMKAPATQPGLGLTAAAAWTLVHQPAAPVNTVAPVVSGTTTVGSTLACTAGTWTGSPTPTFTYQWERNTVAISGATSATYVLQAADVGTSIRCKVTGTNVQNAINGVQTATATSNSVGPIT